MAYDLVIKEANILDGFNSYIADVGIQGDKISAIGNNLSAKYANNEIVARGLWLLPGFIDVHTHFGLKINEKLSTCDDFYTGTISAAFGGVTTVIDFLSPAGEKSIKETFAERIAEADNKSAIDYAFHACLGSNIQQTLQELPWAYENGLTSLKVFTAYSKRGMMQTDENLYKILEKAKTNNLLVTVHAENDSIINYLEHKYEKDTQINVSHPMFIVKSRPPIAELEAACKVALLANEVKTPVYIVHLSSAETANLLANFRQNYQFPILVETCPQYLYLSDKVFITSKGHYFTCCPPIRYWKEENLLWRYIRTGDIQVIATDHCAFTKADKDFHKEDIRKIPMGLPGVETLGILTLNAALKGIIPIEAAVRSITYNPAKIFGLYPQKGCIMPGSDADLVLFDPTKNYKISVNSLHGRSDFCPYDGVEVSGSVIMTISRGKIIVNNGKWLGDNTWGKFIKRKKSEYTEFLIK